MVLRKASEIEEREGSAGSGGLSLDDLQEIAREVGITPEAIAKAVDGLDLAAAGTAIAFVGAALAGAAAGRFMWNRISARSRARVERLAATLSRHAYDASKKGLLVPPKEPEG